jgi:hypothetical protein
MELEHSSPIETSLGVTSDRPALTIAVLPEDVWLYIFHGFSLFELFRFGKV